MYDLYICDLQKITDTPIRVCREKTLTEKWRPLGDSNPCCRRERAVS